MKVSYDEKNMLLKGSEDGSENKLQEGRFSEQKAEKQRKRWDQNVNRTWMNEWKQKEQAYSK